MLSMKFLVLVNVCKHTLTSVGAGIAHQRAPPEDSKGGSAAHLASPADCRRTNGAPRG